MRDKTASLVVFCLFLFSFLAPGAAIGQTNEVDLISNCNINQTAQRIACDLRLNTKVPDDVLRQEEENFSTATVTWPDQESQSYPLSEFGDNGERAAWLILIDQSKSLQAQTLEAIKRDFGKVIQRKGNELIGIGTFAEDFDLVADFEAPRSVLAEELNRIDRVGNQTLLYKAVEKALIRLGRIDAERKALVLVSDGKAEDPNLDAAEIQAIRAATDDNIVIYSVAYAQKPGDTASFGSMRRLAERTGGPFRQADLSKGESLLSQTYEDRFYEFLLNGGAISFPLRTLEDNDVVRFTLSSTVDGVDGLVELTDEKRLPYSGPKVSEGFFTDIAASFHQFVERVGLFGLMILILAILTLIGLAVYVLFFRSRNRDEAPLPGFVANGPQMAPAGIDIGAIGSDYDGACGNAGDMATSILAPKTQDSEHVYGWLEIMENGDRIPLDQTGLRIGRHEDNDIRFDATTVHRRHAVVHMTPQRDFIITDLSGSGGNGVQVNSVRIERAELKDGDVVQFGEVRVKFHASTI